jgi:hypothetical protein
VRYSVGISKALASVLYRIKAKYIAPVIYHGCKIHLNRMVFSSCYFEYCENKEMLQVVKLSAVLYIRKFHNIWRGKCFNAINSASMCSIVLTEVNKA